MADAWTPPRDAIPRAREAIGDRFRGEAPGRFVSASQPAPQEAVDAQADPARRLGRYTLVSQIGRGGMAAVWKSWDRDLGRWVAVKVLHDQGAPSQWPRFLREAQTTARLRHPNLVMVHDAGEFEGRMFLVMELIEGQPLDVRGPRERVVAAIAKVAQGLEEAHRNGMVHRDVKPGNIMVDGKGEPHVVDFGLVHLVDDDHLRLTRTGTALGTPIYMAPEQVSGRGGSIGPATDVYALGVILYETLTGRPPHAGESATELYGRILSDDPVAPRTLNPGAPRDLETIALKALEKDPSRRYPSAGAMAEDLRRHLAGEPILARRSWVFHRWKRWILRHRGAALITLGLVAALAASSTFLARQLSSSRRAVDLWSRVSNLLTKAERLSRQGDAARARERIDEGLAICREAVRESDFPHAHYFLGRFLRERGLADEAERELTLALVLDPSMGEAHLERGRLLAAKYVGISRALRAAALHDGDSTSAVPDAAQAERLHPELRAIRERALQDLSAGWGKSSYFRGEDELFGKAELARMQDDLRGAETLLRQVLALDSSYSDAHFSLAWIADRRGDLEESVRHLSDAIEQHKGLTGAFLFRSAARQRQAGRAAAPEEKARLLELGLQDAEAALRLGDRPVEAFACRGDARWGSGDRAGAIRDYSEAIALDATLPLLRLNRGILRRETGDLGGSLEDLSEALKLRPSMGAARVSLGVTLAAMGKLDEALAELKAAVEAAPDSAPGWTNLGQVQIMKGELDAAVESLDRAVRLAPDSARARLNRAHARQQRKEYALAIPDLDEVIRLDDRNAEAWFARGNARLRLGDETAALGDYEAAIGRDPKHVQALVNRGNLHYLRYSRDRSPSEAAAARKHFEEALRIGMADEVRRGQVEKALEQLKREAPREH